MKLPVRLGYATPEKDKLLTYKNDAHLITVAPSGSGKGRDVLVPALLTYEGSCIVIDPKGQLAAITRKHRGGPKNEGGLGQRIIVLNPFNILPEYVGASARFNPMAALDPSLDSFGTDCDNIADAIVVHESGDRDNHWNDSAHGLISALIGHLAANMNAEDRTLGEVRKILRRPSLLEDAADFAQGGKDEMVAEALDGFRDLAKAPNKGELSSIISTARTQTKFLGTKAIAENLNGSDFRFRELKVGTEDDDRPVTVYLTLPTRYLGTCSKWFRLVVAAALDDLMREETGVPVLVVLDEFYQLGRLKVIQNAMSLARGYGLQLWPILQDLTQLQEHYEKSWETFLGNAGVRMFFAPREMTTAEYVSKLCGETTVTTTSASKGKTENSGRGFMDGTTGKSESTSTGVTQRRVKLPHEVFQIPGDQFWLFPETLLEATFIRGYRADYRTISEFQGKYSPDPYHKPAGTTSPSSTTGHSAAKKRDDLRAAVQSLEEKLSGIKVLGVNRTSAIPDWVGRALAEGNVHLQWLEDGKQPPTSTRDVATRIEYLISIFPEIEMHAKFRFLVSRALSAWPEFHEGIEACGWTLDELRAKEEGIDSGKIFPDVADRIIHLRATLNSVLDIDFFGSEEYCRAEQNSG